MLRPAWPLLVTCLVYATAQFATDVEADVAFPNWASAAPYAHPPGTTKMRRASPAYKIYHNMYWSNSKWYAALKATDMPNGTTLEDGLSVNTAIVRLPVEDLPAFTQNLRIGHLPGNTLLLDFPFPSMSENIGHWAEIMVPTYSVLKEGLWRGLTTGSSQHIDRVLFSNLQGYTNDWFQQVLKLALAPGVRHPQQLPQIVDIDALREFDSLSWLAFENLIVIQDRYTHPQRQSGFIGPEHGDMWRYDGCERYVSSEGKAAFKTELHGIEFRSKAYLQERWEVPPDWAPGSPPTLPRTAVLLLHSDQHAQMTNVPELSKMLHQVLRPFGMRLRLMTLSTDTSFLSQMVTMSETALLIARHGPLLANAIFLPPGAMVLELLPFKWEWQGLSRLFYNLTQSIGDLHHFAWRPLDHKFCHYTQVNDSRYHRWSPTECHARECLSVHHRANLEVDVEAVREILLDKLPKVLEGQPVASLRAPWPPAA